jgi:hypothetical protein
MGGNGQVWATSSDKVDEFFVGDNERGPIVLGNPFNETRTVNEVS